jgi:putative ABC transport system permease protein
VAQASSDAAAIAGRLASAYPATNRGWSGFAIPISDWLRLPDEARLMAYLLMGAVTIVLLIACSNVANLLLARTSGRHRELSIRSALGAGRFRIIRQLLTESVLIALVSVPAGVLVAWGGLRVLDSMIPPDSLPYQWQWHLDIRSLAYMIGVAAITGIVFGTAPAIQATGASLLESLREGGHGSAGERRAWLRHTLVVAQVALALMLLVGSSLFVRSFMNLRGAQAGFDTAPLMTLRFSLAGDSYEAPGANARRVDDIVQRVERLPGVQSAFSSGFIPMSGGGGGAGGGGGGAPGGGARGGGARPGGPGGGGGGPRGGCRAPGPPRARSPGSLSSPPRRTCVRRWGSRSSGGAT